MSDWCKHYNGMPSVVCKAGVNYRELAAGGSMLNLPCIGRGRGSVACSSAVYPTAEEIAAAETASREYSEKINQARKAIVKHAAGKHGIGQIKCPACGAELVYSIARSNGHIAARCSTPGCVRWME